MFKKVPRRNEEEQGSPLWMTSFSDMMTLILVFFVLIYSFSIMDVKKFREFIASFQGTGIMNRGEAPLEEPVTTTVPESQATHGQEQEVPELPLEENPLPEVYLTVKKYIRENSLEDMVEVSYEHRGIAMEIKERILFDSGSAVLKPEAAKLLDPLSGLLEQLNYRISIEGHTDNLPIHTERYPTNWELSTARSSQVIRYFVERHGLDPQKFAAVGLGEYHPVAPNDNPVDRALNRRVIIVVNAVDPYASEVYVHE